MKGLHGQEKVDRISTIVQKYKNPCYLISDFLIEKGDVADMINDTLTYNDLLELRREEGMEMGMEKLLKPYIRNCSKKGASQSKIIEDIMENFNLSREEAQSYAAKFYREPLLMK